jgi:hypothetical protein
MPMSKTMLLVTIAVASFIFGAVDQYFFPGNAWPPTAIIHTLVGIFVVFLWYRRDSDELGYPRSSLLTIGVVAIAVLALPYYFFRSRGLKRGAVATALLLLVYAGCMALYVAGAYASYFGLQS